MPKTFPGWWLSPRHSLRRRATRIVASGRQPSAGSRATLSAWTSLSSSRLALAILVIVLASAGALVALAGDPGASPNQDLLIGLWQVEATLIGLALALIVFALQSGGSTAALRRDLTVSSSFYAAMNLGLVLLVVTGVAALAIGFPFGRWVSILAVAGSALWAVVFAAAVREAVLTIDPVHRISARQRVVMSATTDTLRRELVRNVARSLLQIEVEAAGGTFYPWVLARAELPEHTRIRVGRRGEVVDANIVQIRAVFDQWAEGGTKAQIAVSLWDEVLPESLVAQADRQLADETSSTVANALRVTNPEARRSVSDQIGLLRLEAQENIGPDTSALSAVLEAFDRVLEAYAIGWRAHVDLLEAPHVTGFSREAGAPVRAIREALLELVTSAADKQAADASFALSYWPVHVLRLSVGWRAPAYFEFLDTYPFLYRRVKGTQAGFQERLLDRSWIHLVEFLEILAPTLRPPYVVDYDEALLARAEQRARQALWEVLRAAVRANDAKTAGEALRRWRIAEERGTRSAPARIATGLPMLWEAVRRVTAGQLEGGAAWLRTAAGEARFESVLRGFGELLDPDLREIDLNDWDSWDRPSHEEHVIDSDSDLVRAMLLLTGLVMGPSTALRPIDLTQAMYERRETVAHVAKEMIASAPQYERVYDLESVALKVETFLAAWDEAVARYERGERDRIRSTPLNPEAVDAFAVAVAKTWASGYPRSLLVSHGAVVAPRGELSLLGLRDLMEKRFFIGPPETVDTAAEIGGLHAEALLRGELTAIVEQLSRLRGRTYGLATLTARLERAIEELRGATNQLVVLIPHSWEVRRVLVGEGRFQPATGREEDVVGRFGDVESYDLGIPPPDWVAVIAFPGGVIVEQDGAPFAAVETITPSEAQGLAASGLDPRGDASESLEERFALHVIIDAREKIRVSVDPRFARRVLVPQTPKRRRSSDRGPDALDAEG